VKLSHRFSFEIDAVSAVHDTIADGIGNRWIPDDLMPLVYRNLGYDDGGFSSNPVFQYFQEAQTTRGVKRLKAQIVEDEQILLSDPSQFFQIHSLLPEKLQLLEENRAGVIAGFVTVETALMAQGLSDERFSIMESFP